MKTVPRERANGAFDENWKNEVDMLRAKYIAPYASNFFSRTFQRLKIYLWGLDAIDNETFLSRALTSLEAMKTYIDASQVSILDSLEDSNDKAHLNKLCQYISTAIQSLTTLNEQPNQAFWLLLQKDKKASFANYVKSLLNFTSSFAQTLHRTEPFVQFIKDKPRLEAFVEAFMGGFLEVEKWLKRAYQQDNLVDKDSVHRAAQKIALQLLPKLRNYTLKETKQIGYLSIMKVQKDWRSTPRKLKDMPEISTVLGFTQGDLTPAELSKVTPKVAGLFQEEFLTNNQRLWLEITEQPLITHLKEQSFKEQDMFLVGIGSLSHSISANGITKVKKNPKNPYLAELSPKSRELGKATAALNQQYILLSKNVKEPLLEVEFLQQSDKDVAVKTPHTLNVWQKIKALFGRGNKVMPKEVVTQEVRILESIRNLSQPLPNIEQMANDDSVAGKKECEPSRPEEMLKRPYSSFASPSPSFIKRNIASKEKELLSQQGKGKC